MCTLQKDVFDRIKDVWTLASSLPTLVFMGDRHQLEPCDESNVPCKIISQSEYYQCLSVHMLRKQHRSTDDRLLNFQHVVRESIPDNLTLRRSRTVASEPSPESEAAVLLKHPNTVFIAIARDIVEVLNDWACQALFHSAQRIGRIPADDAQDMDILDRYACDAHEERGQTSRTSERNHDARPPVSRQSSADQTEPSVIRNPKKMGVRRRQTKLLLSSCPRLCFHTCQNARSHFGSCDPSPM